MAAQPLQNEGVDKGRLFLAANENGEDLRVLTSETVCRAFTVRACGYPDCIHIIG